VQGEDLCAVGRHLLAHAVRQRQRGGLGGAVRPALRERDPRQHGQDVDERAPAVGAQDRCERTGDVQRAEEVGVELAVDGVEGVLGEERGAGGDPCVVDHDRHVAQRLGGSGDLCGIGDVERNRERPRRRHGLRIARPGVDLAGAGVEQAAHEGGAQAAVGTGDEHD
jgi:hypothetical protein